MTAYGKHIVVLAGEPSSAPRDTAELSLAYVLDTGKIRYPNDQPTQQQAAKQEHIGGTARKSSTDAKSSIPTSRSGSRQGQAPPVVDVANVNRQGSVPRETAPPSTARPGDAPGQNNMNGSRLPRASIAQAPPGPPPQVQAPTPRTNGAPGQSAPRIKPPMGEARGGGPPLDTVRAVAADNQNHQPSPVTRESPKDAKRPSREASPATHGRRTPTQQAVSKAKAMEAGEAAPLVSGGPSRQRSLRSQRGQNSIDSSEEGLIGRSGSYRLNSDGAGSLRSLGDEPRSPRLTPHQEALVKELEAAKSRSAWYASELALARKAGYHSTSLSSPTLDERAVNQFGDEDRPMIEAFLTMRAELVKMQQAVEQQGASAAKRIAEVEHQRDAAISEAAYARAKLAAHSGSHSGTPQSDAGRDVNEHSERTTEMSRRLALSLAAQSELKAKLDSTLSEVAAEKRARDIAEETAEAAQKRLDEMAQTRNPMEVERLRSELHDTQKSAREEAGRRAQVEEQLRLLQIDKDAIAQKQKDASSRLADHVSSLHAIKASLAANSEKADLLERQLDKERQQREELERKLTKLRADHEERTAELESTSRKLRDAEELAESHAKEASAHREALASGLSKATSFETAQGENAFSEQRISVLQQSAERAHDLAKSNQEAADAAAQKLRAAEERIAGLEAFQEQSSREGMQLRRQLQALTKEAQAHQAENRELKAHLETNQRDANALALQHGTLKDLLGERGVNMADARKSPLQDISPSSRFGTPEQARLRELEQQLQSSLKAHEETKLSYENSQQDAERLYREKIEQLENDYQSAVHYVKGTEKMLKRMKDELTKYKSHNTQLRSDLEAARGGDPGDAKAATTWSDEREALQRSLDELNGQTRSQIATLESNMVAVRQELATAQSERDLHMKNHKELQATVEQSQSELTQLKAENTRLESRAEDAERKVTLLLDQVGQSVVNYRRQSQQMQASQHNSAVNGGAAHNRQQSISTLTSTGQSSTDEEGYSDVRGSMALDNLATELDALRSHWESTSTRNYRLSNQFDFERTPTKETSGVDLSDGLASWRKRLDEEETGAKAGGSGSNEGAMI